MNLLANSSGHDWLSFALGLFAGLVTVLLVKRLRSKREGC